MLDPFIIHQPRSVHEASETLMHFGNDATIYAGGTELLVVMKERIAHFPHLVDIKRVPGLNDIAFDVDKREVVIGALATHRAIERSPVVLQHLPELAALESTVANVRVRNAGTIGGNLCFADPHSDPATLLAALSARLTLTSAAGTREVSAEAFITGFMETVRHHEEIMTAIALPAPAINTGVAYERIKLHERPTAAVAAITTVQDGAIVRARIFAGGVGDRPRQLPSVEAALIGAAAREEAANDVGPLLRDGVMTESDAFESEAYKRQLIRTVGVRAIARAIRDATEREERRHVA